MKEIGIRKDYFGRFEIVYGETNS